ncbi:hypothetical protein MTLP_12290 [Candidatus Methanoliparum sp. LAM-1]|nr:hypothetical protein MTLP_12290 [Candidatus Methanoliparum sp. LAM-1]
MELLIELMKMMEGLVPKLVDYYVVFSIPGG